MASFAIEAVSCISHLMPTEQEIERYFADDSFPMEEGEGEEESFDFSIPLEQEHLEALVRYKELLNEGDGSLDDQATAVYTFLQEVSELAYPFGFWYECCQNSSDRDLALAFILYMMSNQAISPHESLHALFNAALEAVNGILEFDMVAFQLVMATVDDAKERLVAYVPFKHQAMVDALLDNYLETIDRGDEQMNQQLFAIEAVYLKLISSH